MMTLMTLLRMPSCQTQHLQIVRRWCSLMNLLHPTWQVHHPGVLLDISKHANFIMNLAGAEQLPEWYR
jgi:hypothetical protein